jgi:hypothetical protein
MKKIYLLSVAVLVVFLSSCKKDSGIGADILPPEDLLNVKFTDTFTVYAKTLADTFLRSDKLAKNFLGTINDPVFGFQQAGLAMELDKPNTVYNDSIGPFTLDSVVLFLNYDDVYGDTTVPQNFTVRTLNTPINETQAYYSNASSLAYGSVIGSATNYLIAPGNPVKTAPADTTGSSHIIRIKLNSFFGYSILNLGQTTLRDSLRFKNVFPGIVVQNTDNSGKAMVQVNTSSLNTRISIFYKDRHSNPLEMRLYSNILKIVNGSLSNRQNGVNLFSNALSPAVQTVVNSGVTSDPVNYLLGQGGTTIRIGLPTLPSIGRVAVNKAELLVAQVQQNSSTSFSVPPFLLLLKRNTFGNLDALPSGDGVGLLDTTLTDNAGNHIALYKFNISKYVQNISKGSEPGGDLYIANYRNGGTDGTFNSLNAVINGSSINFGYAPARVIVGGPDYPDARYKMKLNLTYTLLR